jgi:hypothetical protein
MATTSLSITAPQEIGSLCGGRNTKAGATVKQDRIKHRRQYREIQAFNSSVPASDRRQSIARSCHTGAERIAKQAGRPKSELFRGAHRRYVGERRRDAGSRRSQSCCCASGALALRTSESSLAIRPGRLTMGDPEWLCVPDPSRSVSGDRGHGLLIIRKPMPRVAARIAPPSPLRMTVLRRRAARMAVQGSAPSRLREHEVLHDGILHDFA